MTPTIAAPRYAIRFAQVLVFNTLIASAVSLGSPHNFWIDFAYSQAIGLLIWLWIDVVGLRAAGANPSRLFMSWWIPLGIALGYVGGNLLVDQFTGMSLLSFWQSHPNIAVGFLVLTFAAGIFATYYFVSQDEIASQKLLRESLERQATQAQLALLQSQLEPHMLFNTLANLRALIATDPERATTMLDRLNDYLRATLGASRASAQPLSAEFARLSDYLELMAVRMGARLRFSLDLPPDLANVPIPSLLLQPLVENSIKHGLEPKVDGGRIQVRAQLADDGRVQILVGDDGVGFDGHVAPTDGFGLAHVRERLHSAYGALGTMEVVANNDHMTLTMVKLPIKMDTKHA